MDSTELERAGPEREVPSPEAGITTPPYLNPTLPVGQRVADLLSLMTLEEKVYQIESQMLIHPEDGPRRPEVGHVRNPAHFAHTAERRRSPSECAEIINTDQRAAIESSRLGIPVLENGESLHGALWGDATCFPQAIALAASWNEDLMQRVGTAIALELRAVGVRQVFAPVVNIARDSRWGRTQETYGEDTFLTSRIAVAYVRGLESQNVIATPKHFAANFADGGRDSNAANFSWRILREIYLPAFKACVQEGGARSVMPAYNSLDGLPCSCNKKLLTGILREEWAFEGFTVSDYGAVSGVASAHCVAADPRQAALLAIEAGLDVELPNGGGELLKLVEDGLLPESVIDKSVGRVLKAKFELGLFERPYVDPRAADDVVRCQKHLDLSLQAAREGIVLLKNEGGILPLDRRLRTIGLFGPTKDTPNLGSYSAPYGGRGGPCVTPLEGIRAAAAGRGPKAIVHTDGQDPAEFVRTCDVAVIFTAINENEGSDRSSLDLPDLESFGPEVQGSHALIVDSSGSSVRMGAQEELIQAIAATGVPTVVVLVTGAAVTMDRWIDRVGAVLQVWYGGEQGGTAIGEVLFGDCNPAGRLPLTFPNSVGQLPLYYNCKPSGRGYAYNDNDGLPLFPFGHGLSYTNFEYDNLSIPRVRIAADEPVRITVDVCNTGSRRGDEVVQLYLRDEVSSVVTPLKQLKGFRRISLDPGEKQTVQLWLTPHDLAILDADVKPVVEPGWFRVMVGSSSADIRLEGRFEVVSMCVEK